MNFEQFMEEWKPFPKDKVTRQADKAKNAGEPGRAREMKAVKNYKTRNTDFHKADQKMVGRDKDKHAAKRADHYDRAIKQWNKGDKAALKAAKKGNADDLAKTDPQTKQGKKADKHNRAGNRAYNRGRAMDAVKRAQGRAWKSEDNQQAEINKKSKEDRAKAKKMMDVTKLEKAHKKPAVKGATKGGFKEHMNFTDYIDSVVSPLYEKEGEIPKCPPGYRFDKEMKMCVPKSPKDAVGKGQKEGDKDLKPGNGAGYNVWGSSGYGGDGFAWEEGPTSNDTYNESKYDKYDEEDKEFAKKDKEMKYGKTERPSSLRPGEVRKPNSRGGFDSNKDV